MATKQILLPTDGDGQDLQDHALDPRPGFEVQRQQRARQYAAESGLSARRRDLLGNNRSQRLPAGRGYHFRKRLYASEVRPPDRGRRPFGKQPDDNPH